MEVRPIQSQPRRVIASGVRRHAAHGLRRAVAGVGRSFVVLRTVVLAGWTEGPRPDARPVPVLDERAEHPVTVRGSLSAPVGRGLSVAALTAVLAVAPVAAQAPAHPPSGAQTASPAGFGPGNASVWPRSMSGRVPAPAALVQRAAHVPRAAPGSIDEAFDARGVIRPADAADAVRPKRTYEVTLYRAKAGDSAWTVARQYGVSTMTIWWANRMEAWERLRVGQLLRVLPISGIEHLVRDGDTLDSIAQAYHADVDAIADFNALAGGVVILGQRIIVPDGRGGRYVPVAGIGRSSSIPRLAPGQADRAPVDRFAVAAPLLAPTPSSPTGAKGTGGVAWPADPEWTAGPGSPPVAAYVPPSEPYVPAWDWGPFPGNTTGGSEPPGLTRPGGPNDGYDSFERLGFIGERPGAAPDQAAGEAPRGGGAPSRDDGDQRIPLSPHSGGAPSRDDDPRIIIPPDAPVPSGHGARDLDWPDGGPPPGPKRGNILIIDDERLTLSEAVLRRGRSLLWPVHGGGRLTQELHAAHSGIDIADLRGTPLLAAESGRVVFAGYRDDRAGRTIYLKHGPALFTGYGHLWRIVVEAGDWVDRGQVIGYMGSTGYSTGSHVHFTLTAGPLPNYHPHALDPLLYLRRP